MNTYISFVIQNDLQHIHDFVIMELPAPKTGLYAENTSQEVLKWANQKQSTLKPEEKIVVLNYFNISNIS